MSMFQFILCAGVIVLGGLIALLVFWLRKRSSNEIGNYELVAPFLLHLTSRIRLRPITIADDHLGVEGEGALTVATMYRLWEELAAEGVKLIGTFTTDDNQRLLIAGQHPENQIATMVWYVPGSAPYVEFITLSASNTVRVISGEPAARALRLESLMVEPKTGPTFRFAKVALEASAKRALDVTLMLRVIERVHAARMDHQLARVPGLDDMLSHGAARGARHHLTDQQQARAMELNRATWLRAVRVALLDNARRKLKLDEDSWRLIENDLILIHPQMHEDEVMASLAEHDLSGTLEAQPLQPNASAGQIFDDINHRLNPEDQRELVMHLNFPVEARLFARKGVLTSASNDAQSIAA